jgi:hypothetical protein
MEQRASRGGAATGTDHRGERPHSSDGGLVTTDIGSGRA